MKGFLVILVLSISSANCSTDTDTDDDNKDEMAVDEIANYDPGYGTSWMFFPDENGNPLMININKDDDDRSLYVPHANPDSQITMWLYNKHDKNNPKYLKKTGVHSLHDFTLDEDFDGRKRTKILVHGWKSSKHSEAVKGIKNAYLEGPEELNIIIVDWSKMAGDINYLRSAASTRNVGRNIAMVIDHMVTQHNAKVEDIHIIGHSLGGHTAGFAGMFLRTEKGKTVGRITGLDPAYPGFEDPEQIDELLDPTDAEFVDVIHTCSGLLGYLNKLGHVDFYPNGGKTIQPGCGKIADFFGACSHGRSYRFFAESVLKKDSFMALRCNSWNAFRSENCDENPVPMGDPTPATARGTYFLETTAGPVFGMLLKKFRNFLP